MTQFINEHPILFTIMVIMALFVIDNVFVNRSRVKFVEISNKKDNPSSQK